MPDAVDELKWSRNDAAETMRPDDVRLDITHRRMLHGKSRVVLPRVDTVGLNDCASGPTQKSGPSARPGC